MRCDLAVFMAQQGLSGFMTDTFGPQPATERMLQIMDPHLRQSSPFLTP